MGMEQYGLEALGERGNASREEALWNLLAEQTVRYTMGESSSVPVGTARELLRSLCFCIDLAGDSSLGIKEQWTQGQQRIKRLLQKGKLLLRAVEQTDPGIENQAYRDTVEALPHFFKMYDVRFFAHQIPCDIDYQLAHPVPETLEGITYVNEYMRRLCIENKFCRCFDRDTVCRLLDSSCADYQGLLINLFEPVFVNALGLCLLGKDMAELEISEEDRENLHRLIRGKDYGARRALLRQGTEQMAAFLRETDLALQEYLCQAGEGLSCRSEASMETGLAGVFLSFRHMEASETIFRDGEQMADAALRRLIAQLQEIEAVGEKVELVRRSVHSIRDLALVLRTCFWQGEAMGVFTLLGEEELSELLRIAGQEQTAPADWVHCLTDYLGRQGLGRSNLQRGEP